jgi:hypothetical protein
MEVGNFPIIIHARLVLVPLDCLVPLPSGEPQNRKKDMQMNGRYCEMKLVSPVYSLNWAVKCRGEQVQRDELGIFITFSSFIG